MNRNPSESMICFDIGGVLVKICQSWQEALAAAGVPGILPPEPKLSLSITTPLTHYQDGKLDLDGYLVKIGVYLGCSPAEAARVHRAILIEEYHGVFDLVQELKERGHRTACLSNTNAEHWDLLTQPQLFPAIGLLDAQLASHLLGCSKPSEEILVKFEEITSVEQGTIYFFDDNPENVAVAIERGWQAHRVDPFSDPAAQMRTALTGWGLL